MKKVLWSVLLLLILVWTCVSIRAQDKNPAQAKAIDPKTTKENVPVFSKPSEPVLMPLNGDMKAIFLEQEGKAIGFQKQAELEAKNLDNILLQLRLLLKVPNEYVWYRDKMQFEPKRVEKVEEKKEAPKDSKP